MAVVYTDQNVSRDIANGLRRRGHTVFSAREEGLAHAGDDVHLLVAAQRGCILLTCDKADFALLHDAWRRWSSEWAVAVEHAGIVVFPQTWPVQRAIVEIDALLQRENPFANELYRRLGNAWVQRPLAHPGG